MTGPTQEAVRVHRSGDTAHFSLHGAVDLFVASTLHEIAERELVHGGDWVIECEELERLDASVLQLLLAIQREVCARGGEFALTGVSDPVERYLDVAGASTLLARRIGRPERTPVQLDAGFEPSDGSVAPDESGRGLAGTGGHGASPEDKTS